MGLSEVQGALARLFTESDLRARFFSFPEETGCALGLDAPDVALLRQMTAAETESVALGLQRKRLTEVSKFLPRTRQAIGVEFAALFFRYAANQSPAGVHKHRDDARQFAAFLLTTDALHKALRWQRDLVRYESAWLEMADLRHRPVLLRGFVHDVRKEFGPSEVKTPLVCGLLVLWLRRKDGSVRAVSLALGFPIRGHKPDGHVPSANFRFPSA